MRLLMLSAILLATTAAAGRDTQVPEATPAGEPVDCLSLSAIRQTRVRSDQVIDFYVGRKVYRNTLPHACSGLGFERRYLHRSSMGNICSLDTITVLHSGGMMEGPSCGLGKFQPVTLTDGK